MNQKILLGKTEFEVHKMEETSEFSVAYELRSARTNYKLYRNHHDRHKLFAVRKSGTLLPGWFTDCTGVLEQK